MRLGELFKAIRVDRMVEISTVEFGRCVATQKVLYKGEAGDCPDKLLERDIADIHGCFNSICIYIR